MRAYEVILEVRVRLFADSPGEAQHEARSLVEGDPRNPDVEAGACKMVEETLPGMVRRPA